MTLSSPYYPKWYYADGRVCEWLFSAPEGFIIAIEFIHFQVSNESEPSLITCLGSSHPICDRDAYALHRSRLDFSIRLIFYDFILYIFAC